MPYNVRQLSDLEEIRELALRYSRGIDRMDPELLRSVYWEDAVDSHGLFRGNRDQLVDFIMDEHDRWRATMECVLNHLIEFDEGGRSARGEIYMITYMFRDGQRGSIIDSWYGRVLDRYEERGGEWRISERICVHEADTSEPVTGTMRLPLAEFLRGSFDRHQPGTQLGPP